MSKIDAMRAMREARYNAAQSAKPRAARPTAAPTAPTAPPKDSQKAPQKAEDLAEAPSEELCGHRNMSGRTCTRDKGHAAKSHRYS
ncbi:hypothetical protein [Aeromicrobium sp.]|uniref:hypothetical protein n=1 Tax=Aeromicrobium sp. TaxID=1871063 RepID=UPI002FC718FB